MAAQQGSRRALRSGLRAEAVAARAGAAEPAAVVVFSRAGCPYCSRAKALLTSRGIRFGVVDLGREPDRRAEAFELSGSYLVPQIFVGRRLIGGFDELKKRDEAGHLADELAWSAKDGPAVAPTPHEQDSARSALGAAGGPLLERAGALRSLDYAAGSAPSIRAFLRYAVTKSPAQDQASNAPLNLAAAPGTPAPAPALPGASAAELVGMLRQTMLELIDAFAEPATGSVDYVRMKASDEWALFRALASELGDPRLRAELASMAEDEKKAFLINLYNAMTFHGVVTFGRRPGWWYLYCFFITPAVSYRLAGVPISLDDIEHGMLRGRPGYFEADSQAFQRDLRMKALDARIHMALNCGARGCPAVGVYRGESLDVELEEAVAAFVAEESNVRVTSAEGGQVSVAMTELFKMYISDFAGADASAKQADSQAGVIRWALQYARGPKKDLLEAAVAAGAPAFRFEWLPYDWTTNGPDVPLDKRIYTPTF